MQPDDMVARFELMTRMYSHLAEMTGKITEAIKEQIVALETCELSDDEAIAIIGADAEGETFLQVMRRAAEQSLDLCVAIRFARERFAKRYYQARARQGINKAG